MILQSRRHSAGLRYFLARLAIIFPMPLSKLLATLALVCLAACGGGGTGPDTPPIVVDPPPVGRPTLTSNYRASGHAAAGDVLVHLFEWRWTDIATECQQVLGPAGYKAIQVSPPMEHAIIGGNPWWERYQPVSYSVDKSRSGTGAEFADMVSRCKAAGVDIYVDAVINHMSGGSGTGSNGTVYTKYNYPGTWQASDFHPACQVNNYQDAANVQDCELVNLSDLNTGSATVRRRLADYLVSLARLGVAGFRVDAAKHIQPVELDAIYALANQTLAAEGRPLIYTFNEVIDSGNEAVHATDYFGLEFGSGGSSDITEFKARGIGDKFLNTGIQRVADLNTFSAANWSLIPSDKAVIFLENHDTQRNAGNPGVGYRDGQTYRLAMVYLLGQPYGYPSVMSSYAFNRGTQSGRDAGPPSDAAGNTNAVSCASSLETAAIGQWVCEHRDPTVARMVGFRRAVAGTDITWRWDDGLNAIAFSRGAKGFVAINRESTALSQTIPTGLAAGTYCDRISGGRTGTTCVGTTLVVASDGTIVLALPAMSAVAIDQTTKL